MDLSEFQNDEAGDGRLLVALNYSLVAQLLFLVYKHSSQQSTPAHTRNNLGQSRIGSLQGDRIILSENEDTGGHCLDHDDSRKINYQ
jgi:hypothetical protein